MGKRYGDNKGKRLGSTALAITYDSLCQVPIRLRPPQFDCRDKGSAKRLVIPWIMISPFTGKDMVRVTRENKVVLHGTTMVCDMEYWRCEDTGILLADEEMEQRNYKLIKELL